MMHDLDQYSGTRRAFTLLEVLFAVSILAVVATVTFMTFSAATTAWQRGTTLVDRLHHGDFVMNQLMVALRSAYYPAGQTDAADYGFQHEDHGDGETAQDRISWVKLGGALIGRERRFAETPHRVRFFLEENEDGELSAAVTAWRLAGQPDDFDEDELEPIFLSDRIEGMNVRTAWELDDDGEIDWQDEWEFTNRLPTVVEVTLYIEPIEPGDPPVEMKRIAGLRVAEKIWQ